MRSMLWNGFELKKGEVNTSVGKIPYMLYCPQMTNKTVNIAIHGEGHEKEDWLCFNSKYKLGNLLKESIRNNSAFIAFDLYGHGEWVIEDKHFNTTHLTISDREILINRSTIAYQEAIPRILEQEGLNENPISITAFSLGCSVALGLKMNKIDLKTILISPAYAPNSSSCTNFFVIRGNNDHTILDDEFNNLILVLPPNIRLERFNSEHEISESWINSAKEFIYT